MKLNIDVSPIQTNINREEIKYFTIKNNTKMFNILSDGLYSDKISAIIRELSCNAWDAHVAAGTQDTPFEIYLPTYLDPEFKIKDYGVGLSPEQVRDVFTVYGESDKTDSNDFTGALGLGSKSPFSYVESYTVISRHNGKQHIYTALKDEIGQPAILHVSTEDIVEPNGIEISFPVLQNDYQQFANRAANILRHFPVRPKIIGGSCVINEKEILLSGDGWRLLKAGPYVDASPTAIMANVQYPINIQSLKETGNIYSALLRLPIEFDFKNGEIDFAASREQLSYTPQTIDAIKTKVQNMLVNLADIISTEFTECKTLWEAKCKWNEGFKYGSRYYILSSLINVSNINVKWKNELIKDNVVSVKSNAFDKIGDVYFGVNNKRAVRANNFPANDKHRYKKAIDIGCITTASYCDPLKSVSLKNGDKPETFIQISAHSKYPIYVCERKPGYLSAFSKMRSERLIPEMSMLIILGDKNVDIKSAIKKISKLCGGAGVKDISKTVSDFKKDIVKVKKTQTLDVFEVSSYYRYGNDYGKNNWSRQVFDTAQQCGYVLIEGWKPAGYNDVNDFKRLNRSIKKLSNLQNVNFNVLPLYGIRINTLKRIKDKSNLLPYRDVVKRACEEYINNNKSLFEKSANAKFVSNKIKSAGITGIPFCINAFFSKISELEINTELSQTSPIRVLFGLRDIFKMVDDEYDNTEFEKHITEIMSIVKLDINDLVKPSANLEKDCNDLIQAINSVQSTYSMLEYISEQKINTTKAKNDILEYIKHIDDQGDKQ